MAMRVTVARQPGPKCRVDEPLHPAPSAGAGHMLEIAQRYLLMLRCELAVSGALPARYTKNLSRPRLSSTSAFTGSEHCHTAGRQV